MDTNRISGVSHNLNKGSCPNNIIWELVVAKFEGVIFNRIFQYVASEFDCFEHGSEPVDDALRDFAYRMSASG